MSEMTPNPLLESLKLPGRIFQLPSRGIFYHNGELADSIKDGEIHVRPMSALDEINMKNPDQLFSGDAVNTVFRTCVQGIEKPAELLSKDVDAVMIFLRAVTYGPQYQVLSQHDCPDAKETEYTVNLDELIAGMKVIDPTLVETNYTLKVATGQVVKLRPNRYQQILDLIKMNESKKELNARDQQENLVLMLLGVIDSVDGVKDKNLIRQWIEAVPSPVVTRISERLEKVNDWGPNLNFPCVCKQCGQTFETEIPINPVSFFTE
jgi:hypothetical protein